MRRFLGVFALASLLVASVAPGVGARSPISRGDIVPANLDAVSRYEASKSLSGKLAKSDPELMGRRDNKLVNVMIKLDVDAVASYRGNIAGLRATSPTLTGKALKDNRAAVQAYRGFANRQANLARRAIQARVPGVKLGRSFLTAFGGLAAQLPASQAKQLLSVPGVAAVQYDSLQQLDTDATPEFIGATAVWPSLGGSSKAGQGVIVGVLDSGIWPENPSFADPGISHPGGTYECDFGDGSDPDKGAAFVCNDKLIGAYTFVDTYLDNFPALEGEFCSDGASDSSDCTARDANGHGSHTAGTAAGSPVSSAVLMGVERGPISGIAPGAHIIAYRVCLDAGCYSSDSVAAVEQAIEDGVDVINFSISGGANAYSDAVELAFLDAYAAGIIVNASAGNSGPGSATANHAGPWTNTVGASTSDRHFLTTLHLSADNSDTLDIEGATITDGAGPAEVVLAENVPGYDDELCQSPLPADSAIGQIVACKRGVIARVDKSKHVEPSGAAGMILYNPVVQGTATDAHYIPSVHIDQPGSDDFLDFLDTHTGVMASWDPGTKTAVQGDVMAAFSSRGPVGDFIKPDVTAPGVQIMAANTPASVGDAISPPGHDWAIIQGTSMSSPHAAGVAALLRDKFPAWSPGQVKSAMMTSSLQSVLKEDGSTAADPFDRGAGSIRANRAVKPTVTFDVNPVHFYMSAGDPFGRIDLNLASINVPQLDGYIVTRRYMRNVSGTTQQLNISTSGPAGAISVSPSSLTVPNGHTREIVIKIDATRLADGQHFGQITIDPKKAGYLDAVLPVAFNKAPGDVSLENSCASDSVAKGSSVECEVTVTNLSPQEANVSVNVKSPQQQRLRIQNWSDGRRAPKGFRWSGALSGSAGPEVIGIESPGYGYLDLSEIPIPGEGGFGDETIVNYGLPSVRFGDEDYNTVGVTSNGYLVLGGGTADDVDFVPQDMPNAARPNNVLAPYWTDLNMADGGDLYIGYDGCYFVFSWEDVPIYGSSGLETRSFQIWILTSECADAYLLGDDDIYFEYGETGSGAGDDDGVIEDDGLVVGAENRDATSGAHLGIDVEPDLSGYYVNTGSSTPGGSKTITYDAFGKKAGPARIVSTLTSNVTPGVTKHIDWIDVFNP